MTMWNTPIEGSTWYHKSYIFDNCTDKLCLMNSNTWKKKKIMLGIVVKGFILIKECMITQALISYPFPHRHLHTSGKGTGCLHFLSFTSAVCD